MSATDEPATTRTVQVTTSEHRARSVSGEAVRATAADVGGQLPS